MRRSEIFRAAPCMCATARSSRSGKTSTRRARGYFPTVARYGANMTPDDMYQGTRLAAAEAINAGMTTVHDWCHNIRSREYAERDLAALNEVGLRARFSYGWAQGQDDKDPLN